MMKAEPIQVFNSDEDEAGEIIERNGEGDLKVLDVKVHEITGNFDLDLDGDLKYDPEELTGGQRDSTSSKQNLHEDLGCSGLTSNQEKVGACTKIRKEKSLNIATVEDGETEMEVDDIEAAINEGSVAVLEVKPIILPLPIIRPSADSKENEIIVRSGYKPGLKSRKKPKACFCTICNMGFPNQQLFQLHQSEVHADKRPYPCQHCGKRFSMEANRKRHETIHNPDRFKGEPKYACDLCDRKYHLKVSLEGHHKTQHLGYQKPVRKKNAIIKEHHSTGVRNYRPVKREIKIFQCPRCELKFEMRCLLQKHMRCHTKERPYKCEICEQTFSYSGSRLNHMRNRHWNPSNSNPRPAKPLFMYNQPCPCTVCGKVFKIPSHLQRHMLTHTGEKPHECSECGQRFGLAESLKKHFRTRHQPKNDYEVFKCLICAKPFTRITELSFHKRCSHRHIQIELEQMKPYGCGVCGKPYYTKGQAMVCSILKHDPTSLQTDMFKIKCPECPAERFGYHSAHALLKHWEAEHESKPFPNRFRAAAGFYGKILNENLPYVRINKEKAKSIAKTGPPSNEIKSELPLIIEFDMIKVEGNIFSERKPKESKRKEKTSITCEICGIKFARKTNLKRHLLLHQTKSIYNCSICNKKFRTAKTFRLHQTQHQRPECNQTGDLQNPVLMPITKLKVGRPRKYPSSFSPSSSPANWSSPCQSQNSQSVNINDEKGVKRLLSGRSAQVKITRLCDIVLGHWLRKKSNYNSYKSDNKQLCDKTLKVVLKRIDEL